jgi:hypothetical protein
MPRRFSGAGDGFRISAQCCGRFVALKIAIVAAAQACDRSKSHRFRGLFLARRLGADPTLVVAWAGQIG